MNPSSMDEIEENEALNKLMTYPFNKQEEIGFPIGKYNGAKRIDIRKVEKVNIIKSPKKFLTVIEQLAREASIQPSLGLEVKSGNKKDYIHFTLDLNETNSVGVFFYDSKRMLAVPQIHSVERLVKKAKLTGAIIIANKIGIPAKQEAMRINSDLGGFGIITIEQYSSIEKRRQDIY